MATTASSSSSPSQQCIICYDDLTYRTLLPCGHNDICPICILRVRHLHRETKCPICKQEAENAIVEETATQFHENFEDYPIWGDELGADFVCQDNVFYRVEYHQREIVPLLGFQCLHCDEYSGNSANNNNKNNDNSSNNKSLLRGLQDHLRTKHRLALCKLCVDHNRDFLSQLPRMTPNEVQNHLKNGDRGTAFKGHPLCEFCRPTRFYDLTQLHLHLNREHYKCDVCDKQGIPNQFFKHYNSLQRHFDNQHFLCHDAGCLQARFVVFESELDLRHHEKQVHGAVSAGSGKISLEFRYNDTRSRSVAVGDQTVPTAQDFDYTLDGVAFVPSDVVTDSSQDNSGIVSPMEQLHLQRTAQLRERAARVAQEQGLSPSQVEAFPTLGVAEDTSGSAANNTHLRAGWNSGSTLQRVAVSRPKQAVGRVTDSAFPSLGPSSASSSARPVASNKRPGAGGTTLAVIQQQVASAGAAGATSSWSQQQTTATSATTTTSSIRTQPVAPVSPKRTPNLTSSEQFPSLAGGSSTSRIDGSSSQPYAAAQALARRQQQPPPLPTSNNQFPALGGRSAPKHATLSATPPQQQAPPQWDNPSDFPAPQSSSANTTSVRDRLLGSRSGGPPSTLNANVLQAPAALSSSMASSSDDAKATIEDLKVTLGKQKYKELKRNTAMFAQGQLGGKAYIDAVAALFEHGSSDSDFWKSVPALVESCPAATETEVAVRYLDHLKPHKTNSAAASAQPAVKARTAPPPPQSSSSQWPAMSSAMSSSAGTATTARNSNTNSLRQVPSKGKAAWGGTGNVTRMAKASPGSVAAQSALLPQQQAPQTATKFMAQEQKKAAAAANQGNNKNKKNKQKNELRKLAYGGT